MSTEVEIGRSKRALRAYSFDDIALVPARRTRDTSEVRVGWQIDAYHVDLPVMASPMDSVMSPETAIMVGRLGGIGVLDLEGLWTRYEDPTEALERIRRADPSRATSVLQEVYRAPVRPELITPASSWQGDSAPPRHSVTGAPWSRRVWTSWSSAAPSCRPSTSPDPSSPSTSSASSTSSTCPWSSAG